MTVEVRQIASRSPRAPCYLRRGIDAPEKRGERPEDEDAMEALIFHGLAGLFFGVVAFVAGDAETGLIILGMVAASVGLSLHAEVRLNVQAGRSGRARKHGGRQRASAEAPTEELKDLVVPIEGKRDPVRWS